MTNGNTAPPLADAPKDLPDSPHATPLNYRAEFLIETAEGFHVLIAGEQLTPRDAFVWIKNASAELAKQGFKPVRRDITIEMPTPVAAVQTSAGQPAGATGEATWIKGEGGAPPRCSLHGAAVWREGNNDNGHYAFWSCKTRGCRPKGSAA